MTDPQEIYLTAKYDSAGRLTEMVASVQVPAGSSTEVFLTLAARALAKATVPREVPSPNAGPWAGTTFDNGPAYPKREPGAQTREMNVDALTAPIEDLWAAKNR